MIRYTFYLTSIFLISFLSRSQNLSIEQYRASDGLNTDMIKCIMQDKNGYIWIGTDEGLIRYDGVQFVAFPEATSSNYIKKMVFDLNQNIIVLHDFGVVKIHSEVDTTYFEELISGERTIQPQKVHYPKDGYIDSYGNLWIAEPQSISKLNKDNFRRYDLGRKENSESFTKSFDFHQLNKDSLLVASYNGSLLLYRYSLDSIFYLRESFEDTHYQCLEKVNKHLFLGTTDGVFELFFTDKSFNLQRLGIGSNVTSINGNQQYLIACGENQSCIIIDPETLENEDIENTEINTYDIFKDSDENFWVSTEKGVLLIRDLEFYNIRFSKDQRFYIESLILDSIKNTVYALSKETIWKINIEDPFNPELVISEGSYFLTGLANDGNLWVNDAAELVSFKDDQFVKRIDFSDYGKYIFEMHPNDENTFYFKQEALSGYAEFNTENFEYKFFNKEYDMDMEVSAIEKLDSGLLVAVNQEGSYLYFKRNDENYFRNISYKIPPSFNSNFSIEDIEIDEENIWLATNYGIFLHNRDTIRKLSFNEDFDSYSTRTIQMDGDYIWFGNTFGLFRYNKLTGYYDHFNEKNGISINAINEEGITISDNKVFVGTSQGVDFMSIDEYDYHTTKTPRMLSYNLNGEVIRENSTPEKIPFNSLFEVNFASLSYPADLIYYSYRLLPQDTSWTKPSQNQLLQFINLKEGDYVLEIRAKKLGKYNWSESASFSFTVEPSFFNTKWFYLLLIITTLVLVLITRAITSWILRKRQKILKTLVNERTKELNNYKENLEVLVKNRTQELEEALDTLKNTQNQLIQTEKMASLGILTAGVAHEINNPINYVKAGLYSIDSIVNDYNSFQSKDEMQKLLKEVLENMNFGVERIIGIVSSLSRFSRGEAEEKSDCNINTILDNCLMILDHRIRYNIQINKSYASPGPILLGNESSLHQLFINLLTNAVDAVKQRENSFISIETKVNQEKTEISIQDNGVGIEQNSFKNLFDPFYTTKSPGAGTGLGLFIAHKIVEDHDGKIKFLSEVGKGTTVLIIFNTSESEN